MDDKLALQHVLDGFLRAASVSHELSVLDDASVEISKFQTAHPLNHSEGHVAQLQAERKILRDKVVALKASAVQTFEELIRRLHTAANQRAVADAIEDKVESIKHNVHAEMTGLSQISKDVGSVKEGLDRLDNVVRTHIGASETAVSSASAQVLESAQRAIHAHAQVVREATDVQKEWQKKLESLDGMVQTIQTQMDAKERKILDTIRQFTSSSVFDQKIETLEGKEASTDQLAASIGKQATLVRDHASALSLLEIRLRDILGVYSQKIDSAHSHLTVLKGTLPAAGNENHNSTSERWLRQICDERVSNIVGNWQSQLFARIEEFERACQPKR